MKQSRAFSDTNNKLASEMWGPLTDQHLIELEGLTEQFNSSVAHGDVKLLGNRWYVTHSGLLGFAWRRRCNAIHTEVLPSLSDPASARWVAKATVYKGANSKGFVGYGDADPSNASNLVRGAEMRMAETRAVNRALRKAYGIGFCSVEEISTTRRIDEPGQNVKVTRGNNNSSDAQPARLRDRLLLLIRKHGLDADQVKAFAQVYCGKKPLRDASREEITRFVEQLTELVAKNRKHALEVLARYAIQQDDNPMPETIPEQTAEEAA